MICNLIENPPKFPITSIEDAYVPENNNIKLVMVEIPYIHFFWEKDEKSIEKQELFEYMDAKDYYKFDIMITSKGFKLFISPSLPELFKVPRQINSIQSKLLNLIYESVFGTYTAETEASFCAKLSQIYSIIVNHNSYAKFEPDTSQYSQVVKTEFRDYQLRSIEWMSHRERHPQLTQQDKNLYFIKDDSELPHYLSTNKSIFDIYQGEPPNFVLSVSGGFLADEMGLGKTLEIIGLILKNKRCPDLSPAVLEIIEESNNPVNPCIIPPLSPPKSIEPKHLNLGESEIVSINGVFVKKIKEKGKFVYQTIPIDEDIFCVCGGVPTTANLAKIQCSRCRGKHQHMKCVGYDKTDKFPYICPLCWYSISIQSGSTLIVSPDHIWFQWFEEICKHANENIDLNVVLYSGIDKEITKLQIHGGEAKLPSKVVVKNRNVWFIQPHHLAMADIVLVPFSVLNREPHLSCLETVRYSSRGHKRYIYPPSPLCCVKWHRICLDEAQMIENGPSRASQLLSKLKSDYRWCISGTPVEKSLFDLVGILKFLRIDPFENESDWIETFIHEVYYEKRPIEECTLTNILKEIMWRNTKASVTTELNLPEVEYISHSIEFSPIEKFIYDREVLVIRHILYNDCYDVYRRIPDDNTILSSLNPKISFLLDRAFEKIRQCCVHGSLVFTDTNRNGRKRKFKSKFTEKLGHDESKNPKGPINNKTKGLMTMDEMTNKVIQDVRNDCEFLLRDFIMNSNGLASCFIILGKTDEARRVYASVIRKILKLENERGVLADRFQMLHTMENYRNFFPKKRGAYEEPPLSIEEVNEKIFNLRSAHIERGLSGINGLANIYTEKVTRYDNIEPDISLGIIHFWFEKYGDEFMQQECESLFEENANIVSVRFRESLLSVFSQVLEKRKKFQKKFKTIFQTYTNFIKNKQIEAGILAGYQAHCGQKDIIQSKFERTNNNTRTKARKSKIRSCIYCETMKEFESYRKLLYSQNNKDIFFDLSSDDDEIDIEVKIMKNDDSSFKKNPYQIMCDVLSKRIQIGGFPFIDEKDVPFLFEFLTEEVYIIQKLFPKIRYWWNLYEETLQASTRLQSVDPDGPAYLPLGTVDQERATYEKNSEFTWDNLTNSLSKLQFLINIKKSDSNMECPTCLATYDEENPKFVLLSGCWHPLCSTCFYKMDAMADCHRKCPLCRISFPPKLGNFKDFDNMHKRCPLTMLQYKSNPEDSNKSSDCQDIVYNVKCDHSSKISVISKEIIKINKNDPSAKILIFSLWNSVLKSVGNTLEKNHIRFCELLDTNDTKNSNHLSDFRSTSSDSTNVLLMSLKLASNGINLTEANHVFFVEPVLNTGREAQAISRIHRMGQERKCFIHWFLVKDTIEPYFHGISRKTASNILNTGDLMNLKSKRKNSLSHGSASDDDLQYFNLMNIRDLKELLAFDVDNNNRNNASS